VHEYQPVLDDWDAWTPNIPVGSWIAFHDVTHVFPGVGKAIAERWTPERWSEPVQVESLWTARRIK
jgi:hypothetical protein